MSKHLYFLLLFLGFYGISFGQDFKFTWTVKSMYSNATSVIIEKVNSKSTIQISSSSNKKVVKRFKKKDIEKLLQFLDRYEFKSRGSMIAGHDEKEYHTTTFLADTNYVMIDGKTYSVSSLKLNEFGYDSEKKMCYKLIHYLGKGWLDGYEYEAEYVINGSIKKSTIYCARVSPIDCELYQLIYNLIVSYDKKQSYTHLQESLKTDQPHEGLY